MMEDEWNIEEEILKRKRLKKTKEVRLDLAQGKYNYDGRNEREEYFIEKQSDRGHRGKRYETTKGIACVEKKGNGGIRESRSTIR